MHKKISGLIIVFFLLTGFQFKAQPPEEKILTGKITSKTLQSERWYRVGCRNYKPNKNVIDSLKTFKGYTLLIFGGNWCSDTRTQLPAMMKVLKLTGLDKNTQIFFTDRKKECPNCGDFDPKKYNILYVPTFIIMDSTGKEKGRIVETPKLSLEKDLLKILNQP
jgi:hypothetical protein